MRLFKILICLFLLPSFAAQAAYTPYPPMTTGSKVRVEAARFGDASDQSSCSSSPCTIYSQTGGISSVTRTSTGLYVINFAAGKWASAPSCSCWIENSSGDICYGSGSQTTTAITMSTWTGVSQRDNSVAVICVGNRP